MDLLSYKLGKKAGGGASVNLQNNKAVTITSNTTTEVNPDTNYDGMKKVTITTNIPTPTGNINITTTNSTDVTNYATAQVVDADLVAGNIKKDVNILGITGTYEGSGGGLNWSTIGYSDTPQSIQDGYDYAVQIKNNYTTNQKFQNDKDITFMPYVNTSNETNWQDKFNTCPSLIDFPNETPLNTSNVTNFNRTFYNCTSLKKVPLFNTSSATNLSGAFSGCSALKEIPLFDTSSATDISSMFNNCSQITSIPAFDTSKVTTMSSLCSSCSKLATFPKLDASKVDYINFAFGSCSALTTFGGLENLGQAYLTTQSANYSNYMLNLSQCNQLTHDSLMNIINNLYDIATKGCNAQKLNLGTTNLNKLTTEEKAIATNKGWNLA